MKEIRVQERNIIREKEEKIRRLEIKERKAKKRRGEKNVMI